MDDGSPKPKVGDLQVNHRSGPCEYLESYHRYAVSSVEKAKALILELISEDRRIEEYDVSYDLYVRKSDTDGSLYWSRWTQDIHGYGDEDIMFHISVDRGDA